MRRSKLLFSSILATVLGMGVIGGVLTTKNTESKPVEKVEANDEEHDIYLAISGTSYLTEGTKIMVEGQYGDGGSWATRGPMTLQGTCTVSSSTKLLFKGKYYEKYGGLDGLRFKVYNGDTWKRDLPCWANSWKGNSEIEGKVIVFNGNNSYTIDSNIPSTSSKSSTYYFVPHAVWNSTKSETFKLSCCFDQFEVGYISGTKVTSSFNGSAIWRFSYSGKCVLNYVVFNRLSSAGVWWNKSGYVAVDGGYSSGSAKDIYVMPYGESSYDGFTSGSWQTNPKVVKLTTDQSPSTSTGRVFFYNSGTHWADNSGANKGCAVYAWGGSASPTIFTGRTAEATIYNLTWFNDDNGNSYGYADIPTDVTGYKICRITAVDDYGTDTGYFSTNQFTPDSFAYVRYGQSEGDYISSGGAKDNVAGANLMKKVIEAYNTCSNSVLNGYGAYSALNTNFYSHATAAAKSATHKSLNGSTASIQAHFEAMASRAAGNGQNSTRFVIFGKNNADFSSVGIIVLVSILSSIAVGGYFILRRKKQK